jgi:serine/threonine protein kinase
MAPELLKGEEYVGELADIWSFGVLVYFLTQGTYPFRAETVK